jgi:hypothetical protein
MMIIKSKAVRGKKLGAAPAVFLALALAVAASTFSDFCHRREVCLMRTQLELPPATNSSPSVSRASNSEDTAAKERREGRAKVMCMPILIMNEYACGFESFSAADVCLRAGGGSAPKS